MARSSPIKSSDIHVPNYYHYYWTKKHHKRGFQRTLQLLLSIFISICFRTANGDSFQISVQQQHDLANLPNFTDILLNIRTKVETLKLQIFAPWRHRNLRGWKSTLTNRVLVADRTLLLIANNLCCSHFHSIASYRAKRECTRVSNHLERMKTIHVQISLKELAGRSNGRVADYKYSRWLSGKARRLSELSRYKALRDRPSEACSRSRREEKRALRAEFVCLFVLAHI